MKIIVTGGAGFIGSHIAERLLNDGHQVTVIDNLSTGLQSNIDLLKDNPNFTFAKGSITDFDFLTSTFAGHDAVIHQAALPSVPKSIEKPLLTNEANITGTINVFIAARDNNIKRVVFASSSSVYGDSEELPKVENHPTKPLSPYALQKLTDEHYAKLFSELYGLEIIGLRYFNVFGPRQRPDSDYAAVIPKFISLMLKDKQPTIYGDGTTTRDFTYIENVVNANLLALTTQNLQHEVFNVACGDSFSLLDLVNGINKALNKNIVPLHDDFRQGDIKDSLASIEKAKKLLSYQAKVSFEQGLQKTVNYFLTL